MKKIPWSKVWRKFMRTIDNNKVYISVWAGRDGQQAAFRKALAFYGFDIPAKDMANLNKRFQSWYDGATAWRGYTWRQQQAWLRAAVTVYFAGEAVEKALYDATLQMSRP